jgi:hypothetical protein
MLPGLEAGLLSHFADRTLDVALLPLRCSTDALPEAAVLRDPSEHEELQFAAVLGAAEHVNEHLAWDAKHRWQPNAPSTARRRQATFPALSRPVVEGAGHERSRLGAASSSVRTLSGCDLVRYERRQGDELARERRELDTAIQETNWTTELV